MVQNDASSIYEIAPPLLNSYKELCYLRGKFFKNFGETEANKLKLPADAFPLPCLIGASIKKTIRCATQMFWSFEGNLLSPFAPQVDTPFAYYPRTKDAIALQFCPLAILKRPEAPFEQSIWMLLCVYTIVVQKKPPYKIKYEIQNFCVVPSLSTPDLTKVLKALEPQIPPNIIKVPLFRRILARQAYILYGVIPSFIRLDHKIPLSSDLDFLFDSSSTVLLHPTVANWWTCALCKQVSLYSDREAQFPDPDQDPSLFQDKWEETWKDEFFNSFHQEESFFTRLYLKQDHPKECYPGYGFRENEQNHFLYGTSLTRYCSVALDPGRFTINSLLQPVAVLLRPFYQRPLHHDFLTQNLHKACTHWMYYTAANSSRTFFVTALLAAAYREFCPETPLTELTGYQLLKELPHRRLLSAQDPSFLAAHPDHPLLSSQLLWETLRVPPKQSLKAVLRRLQAVKDKFCVVVFEDPPTEEDQASDVSPTFNQPRPLSAEDCTALLCCGESVLLVNALLPDSVQTLPITLHDLGIPGGDVPAAEEDARNGFPSIESFFILCMIADRTINRLAWFQSSQNLLKTHLDAGKTFWQLCSPQTIFGIPEKFYKYFSNSLKRHKNPPSQALQFLDQRVEEHFSLLCSKTALHPYQPMLRFLYLMGYASCVMNSHDPQRFFLIYKAVILGNHFYTAIEQFYSLLPLKQKLLPEMLPDLYPKFIRFLKEIQEKDPPVLCNSKEEYLYQQKVGAAPLGWKSDTRLYLNYDQYWNAFLAGNSYRNLLASKQNKFQREILNTKAGEFLHRDDTKSGRWYCRYWVTEKGEKVCIGRFLVLDRKILD